MEENVNPVEEGGLRVLSPEEANLPPVDLDTVMSALRAIRNNLLAESDIMVLPDRWDGYTAEQKTTWTAYRQTLRDLPETVADPFNPAWPDRPE